LTRFGTASARSWLRQTLADLGNPAWRDGLTPTSVTHGLDSIDNLAGPKDLVTTMHESGKLGASAIRSNIFSRGKKVVASAVDEKGESHFNPGIGITNSLICRKRRKTQTTLLHARDNKPGSSARLRRPKYRMLFTLLRFCWICDLAKRWGSTIKDISRTSTHYQKSARKRGGVSFRII